MTPTIATVHITEIIVTTSCAKSSLWAKSEPCSPSNPNITVSTVTPKTQIFGGSLLRKHPSTLSAKEEVHRRQT